MLWLSTWQQARSLCLLACCQVDSQMRRSDVHPRYVFNSYHYVEQYWALFLLIYCTSLILYLCIHMVSVAGDWQNAGWWWCFLSMTIVLLWFKNIGYSWIVVKEIWDTSLNVTVYEVIVLFSLCEIFSSCFLSYLLHSCIQTCIRADIHAIDGNPIEKGEDVNCNERLPFSLWFTISQWITVTLVYKSLIYVTCAITGT